VPGGAKNILSEHLWLVARWYYSNPREGEIFFRDKDWPFAESCALFGLLSAPKIGTGRGQRPTGSGIVRSRNEHTGYSTGHRALCRKILGTAAPGHFGTRKAQIHR